MNRLTSRTLLRSPFGRSLSLIMVAFTMIPIIILTALSVYTVQVQLRDRSITQAKTVIATKVPTNSAGSGRSIGR